MYEHIHVKVYKELDDTPDGLIRGVKAVFQKIFSL